MKIGLFLALLVLLASTNVFGETTGTKDIPETVHHTDDRDRTNFKSDKTTTVEHREGETFEPTGETKTNRRLGTGRDGEKPFTVIRDEKKTVTEIHEQTKPIATETERGFDGRTKVKSEKVKFDDERENHYEPHEQDKSDIKSDKLDKESHELDKSDIKSDKFNKESHEEDKSDIKSEKFNKEPHDDERIPKAEPLTYKVVKPIVVVDPAAVTDNLVHVSGNIILVKHRTSVIDSVQYDLDGSRLLNGGRPVTQARLPFAQNFIARHSRVKLYVSTSKTTDRKLAFAEFPIKYQQDHFPLTFNVDVELPNQQRGLLDRADITLYFFVYVINHETHVETFLPAGTSQILLQGTNRLVQKLDVYIRANGIEVNGLFRGRFGERYIRPGTSFQVFVVSEQSLALLHTPAFESVAQLTINNVPAMFPVPFSLLVHHQMLKPNTKYYAIAYIFENGVRRIINQEPRWVINDQKLVTPQIIFNVVASPFILRGTVTRSMPGSFALQPRSSLILRLHQIGSDSRDIIFKLPEMLTLPQVFQVNISQAIRFDPSKNYDIRALVTDEKNNIYMASLQPIPLLDEFSRLIVPVDDLLYYVQARLQSSSNTLLSYIPGSTAQIFVTETPETPSRPIVALRIDRIDSYFREFSLQVPATAIQRGRNYYLVMMIEINGTITHVSKTLLISNNQPPPFLIQLPVLSLNLVSGIIFDVENRPAQWSSSSYASLYLLDDQAENPDKAVVQVWKIHLENDFPVRFEVQLDFSRLRADHVYRLQGAIENGRGLLEYKPAGSVLTLNPVVGGIISDVRIPVHNVKTFQLVKGLIYINDVRGPLPEKGEIIVQLSSSPLLTHPSIIDEIRIKVDGRSLPVDFTMNLPLNKIDLNSVYYFLVRYVVRDSVIIPSTQAFAFSPRNEATVVLTLSKTPQIPITGQVTSTGNPLALPVGSTLHLYITDNFNRDKPMIYSEVFLQATSNSLYEFTMNIDSLILQKNITLYLRADILYEDTIILSIPRPALLQITPGGEWNINLVVDFPTLLIGQIVSMSQLEAITGEFDVFVQILERGTTNIVHTARLRLAANFPQKFRIELDNDLFIRYPGLQARALIKNCKDQILFETGGAVNIHTGLNVKVDLAVVLTDRRKLTELTATINEIAPLDIGVWRLSVTGVTDDKNGGITAIDNNFVLEK